MLQCIFLLLYNEIKKKKTEQQETKKQTFLKAYMQVLTLCPENL